MNHFFFKSAFYLTSLYYESGETNLDSILSNIRRGNSDGVVSVFSLAFGSGADYSFLTKVSAQNKGFARKIYEASDATLQLTLHTLQLSFAYNSSYDSALAYTSAMPTLRPQPTFGLHFGLHLSLHFCVLA